MHGPMAGRQARFTGWRHRDGARPVLRALPRWLLLRDAVAATNRPEAALVRLADAGRVRSAFDGRVLLLRTRDLRRLGLLTRRGTPAPSSRRVPRGAEPALSG